MDSQNLDAILCKPCSSYIRLSFCPKMASEAISEHLISKNLLREACPQSCMHTHKSDVHVTPIVKILATGLYCLHHQPLFSILVLPADPPSTNTLDISFHLLLVTTTPSTSQSGMVILWSLDNITISYFSTFNLRKFLSANLFITAICASKDATFVARFLMSFAFMKPPPRNLLIDSHSPVACN